MASLRLNRLELVIQRLACLRLGLRKPTSDTRCGVLRRRPFFRSSCITIQADSRSLQAVELSQCLCEYIGFNPDQAAVPGHPGLQLRVVGGKEPGGPPATAEAGDAQAAADILDVGMHAEDLLHHQHRQGEAGGHAAQQKLPAAEPETRAGMGGVSLETGP